MQVTPELQALQISAQVIWGEADPVFDMEPSLNWLHTHLGGLRKVTRAPRAKLFFPKEHPTAPIPEKGL